MTNGQDWAYLMRQVEFRQTKFTHSLIKIDRNWKMLLMINE